MTGLQRRFDGGDWSGAEALEFVRETGRLRRRLSEEFGMNDVEIETALQQALAATTP